MKIEKKRGSGFSLQRAMLGISLPTNGSQISEEIPSSLVIMSYREWDSGEGRREEQGGGSQISVTPCDGQAKFQVNN